MQVGVRTSSLIAKRNAYIYWSHGIHAILLAINDVNAIKSIDAAIKHELELTNAIITVETTNALTIIIIVISSETTPSGKL